MVESLETPAQMDVAVRLVDAPTPGIATKVIIGLDTWVWREFAKAYSDKDSPLYPALNVLLTEVESGRVILPLAQTVYLELGPKSLTMRTQVATVAARLSRWHTFMPSHVRIRQEIDLALRGTFGRPLRLDDAIPSVGWGAKFALTGENARLGLVGADVGRYVRSKGIAYVDELLTRADEVMQFQLFRGPDDSEEEALRRDYGYAPEQTWAVAMERAGRHQRMRESLLASADLRTRPKDLVDVSELGVEINDILSERMLRAGIDPQELLDRGREGMQSFLDELPSSVVRRAVIQHALTNRSRAVNVNDISDGDLYAEVVPASRIVVAEKSVRTALIHDKIDKRYGVTLLRGKDLPDIGSCLARIDGSGDWVCYNECPRSR